MFTVILEYRDYATKGISGSFSIDTFVKIDCSTTSGYVILASRRGIIASFIDLSKQTSRRLFFYWAGFDMFFSEGKLELYNTLFLLVIPILVPVLMFFIKRKLLWVSPFAAIMIGLGLTAVFYPYFFTDLFADNNEIGGGWWWLIYVLPVHCVVTVVATAILYAVSRIVKHYGKKVESVDNIVTVESPTKGTMRMKVEERDSEVRFTLLDGVSAGYGFSIGRVMAFSRNDLSARIPVLYRLKMRRHRKTLPPMSQEEIYNAAKDFIEQLGPSGYLDDGP